MTDYSQYTNQLGSMVAGMPQPGPQYAAGAPAPQAPQGVVGAPPPQPPMTAADYAFPPGQLAPPGAPSVASSVGGAPPQAQYAPAPAQAYAPPAQAPPAQAQPPAQAYAPAAAAAYQAPGAVPGMVPMGGAIPAAGPPAADAQSVASAEPAAPAGPEMPPGLTEAIESLKAVKLKFPEVQPFPPGDPKEQLAKVVATVLLEALAPMLNSQQEVLLTLTQAFYANMVQTQSSQKGSSRARTGGGGGGSSSAPLDPKKVKNAMLWLRYMFLTDPPTLQAYLSRPYAPAVAKEIADAHAEKSGEDLQKELAKIIWKSFETKEAKEPTKSAFIAWKAAMESGNTNPQLQAEYPGVVGGAGAPQPAFTYPSPMGYGAAPPAAGTPAAANFTQLLATQGAPAQTW